MSEQELDNDVGHSEKYMVNNRKKRHQKKVKRLGIPGSSSDGQQKEKPNSTPVLRHMNPPATPKGLSVLCDEVDGGELVSTHVPSGRKRGRPARKEVRTVEGAPPLSPKASTSKNHASQQVLPSSKQVDEAPKTNSQTATHSSSLNAVQASHSVNEDVQQDSDTGKGRKVDSNNNKDDGSVEMLYIEHDGQLVPFALPEVPQNLRDIGGSSENEGNVALNLELLQTVLAIGQDVKTILRNQENFHIRLSALEDERNTLASEGRPSITLPMHSVEDFIEKEELLNKDAVARKQLVSSLSIMGGSKLYETVALMLRNLMTKELRLKFNAQIPKEGKMVFKSTNLFKVVEDAVRLRPRLGKVSTSEILQAVGNLFTRTADEKGGRERRRETAALKKIALEEYKKSHPEKFESRRKDKSQDDFSDNSHSSSDSSPYV